MIRKLKFKISDDTSAISLDYPIPKNGRIVEIRRVMNDVTVYYDDGKKCRVK